MPVSRLTVVGTGLIGASVGLAAKRAGVRVAGWDPDPGALAVAAERGAVDDPAASLEAALSEADLAVIAADSTTFGIALDAIRSDALHAGLNPVDLKPFEHRAMTQTSPGGHKITSFVGNGTIFKQLSRPVRHVGYIGTRTQH